MKVLSATTITLGGFSFKASQNDKDGYVLLVVTNSIIEYFCIKSFRDTESASRWVSDMGDKIRSIRGHLQF